MKSAYVRGVIAAIFVSGLVSSVAHAADLRVDSLKTEYHRDPLGLDVDRPRLSWVLQSSQKNVTQAAYQIVARGPAGVLWDSGKVSSDQSIHVPYGGPALKSRDRVDWTVQVWDQSGAKASSKPAFFEMGLLNEADWGGALWIGEKPSTERTGVSVDTKLSWIWYPDAGDLSLLAPAGNRAFRKKFTVQADKEVQSAFLVCASDGQAKIWINGHTVGTCTGTHLFGTLSIKELLRTGENTLTALATNNAEAAGFVGQIIIQGKTGAPVRIGTDSTWEAATLADSVKAIPDAGPWVAAKVVAAVGKGKYWTPFDTTAREPAPVRAPVYLRREWDVAMVPKRARISATALGIYEIAINGKRVGNEYFAPGWTEYTQRLQVQTYDVTSLLRKGRNVITATLADGWYAGNLGWGPNSRNIWGDYPLRLRAKLDLQGKTTETIVTDSTWKFSNGPIRSADFYNGERYDARNELVGWDKTGYDDKAWNTVDAKVENRRLVASPGGAVIVTQELKPRAVTTPRPGVYVFDMGQNMVGWVRMKVRGAAGTIVTLRFAEMLNPDGTVYMENMRKAEATDQYTLSGRGNETWEPRFTFRGFRYVELTGFPGKPTKDTLLGRVAHSDIPSTLSFSTSSKLLNQLQSNIDWGQRGNFVSVPTDCPQRDERLGWMGDANIFVQTACMNRDVAAFFTKWIRDTIDSQKSGSYSDVTPNVPAINVTGAPAWGDAGVHVPMAIYECYADRELLAEAFPHMAQWVDYILRNNPGLLWKEVRGNDYGDWLSIADDTDKEVLATAFFFRSASEVSQAATILGHEAEAKKYRELAERIRKAFIAAYVDLKTGAIRSGTQTVYSLALRFGLLSDDLVAKAGQQLLANVERHGTHLSTGFVGVSHLLPAISQIDRDDVAFALLNQTTYPSWLYSVLQGATTIWERWNGWTHDKGFFDPGMNSFNHYSFGSVGAWMYNNIAGLQAAAPGWKQIRVVPKPSGGLDHATAMMITPYGNLGSKWTLKKGRFELNVEIPVNTTAEIHVPGKLDPKTGAPGLTPTQVSGNTTVFKVGSGRWKFTSGIE